MVRDGAASPGIEAARAADAAHREAAPAGKAERLKSGTPPLSADALTGPPLDAAMAGRLAAMERDERLANPAAPSARKGDGRTHIQKGDGNGSPGARQTSPINPAAPADSGAAVETPAPPISDRWNEPEYHAAPPQPVISHAGGTAASRAQIPDQPPLLFECAWEVCWQLGGIYTVLRSKAAAMLERWNDRYFLIGPYNPNTAAMEFEERPTEGFIRETLDRLRNAGMPCHYGRWLIQGRPNVILLDYRARFPRLGEDKYVCWKDHGIETPDNDGELNEVIAFGFAVAEFFRQLTQVVKDRKVLAHFHEWMGGMAVPRIAHLRLPVTTVFTTHATLLGRYLASDSAAFYDHLPFLDAEKEAAKYLIYPRFAIERAAAHAATVFTTVSDVTGFEAEKLLGRKPEVILPNGLNIQRFAALHEFQNLHRQYKEHIHEFVMGHFFPNHSFDLDRTLYFFTSGRYEYRNKGMDLFVDALARLNWRLKGMPDRPTVVAFIVTRAPSKNLNVQSLQSQTFFDDLKNTCLEQARRMGEKLFRASATGRLPTYGELLDEDAQVRIKRAMSAWRTGRQPSIVTHDLWDDQTDAALTHLRTCRLFNAADDPVKVVYHPEFVTMTSPFLSMDYDNFVRGCHLGVFPSYYEPWGYTPMESVALGVPAVTSDLSGFGTYVQKQIPESTDQGILVLERRYKGYHEAADALADYMFAFCQMNRRERIELRNRVERLSEMFDWSALACHYDDAHNLALERHGVRMGKLDVRVV